jgi:hypothetical protein
VVNGSLLLAVASILLATGEETGWLLPNACRHNFRGPCAERPETMVALYHTARVFFLITLETEPMMGP